LRPGSLESEKEDCLGRYLRAVRTAEKPAELELSRTLLSIV